MLFVVCIVFCSALTALVPAHPRLPVTGRGHAGCVRVGRSCPGGQAGRHTRGAEGDRAVPHGGLSSRVHRRRRAARCLGGGELVAAASRQTADPPSSSSHAPPAWGTEAKARWACPVRLW